MSKKAHVGEDFDVNRQINLAEKAFRSKNWTLTANLCTEILAHEPNAIAAERLLTGSLMGEGKWSEAYRWLLEAVRRDPHDGLALKTIGIVSHQLGAFDDAVAYYYRALAENYAGPSLYKNLGASLVKINRCADAAEAYTSALALEPSWHDAWLFLGHARLSDGKLDESIRNFQKYTAIEPKDIKGYLGLSQVYVINAYAKRKHRQFLPAAKALIHASLISPFDPRLYGCLFRLLKGVPELAYLRLTTRPTRL